MTCSHCAAFNANVFPKIKSEYIDTGKVRSLFREFPLDSKAAVRRCLARCIAKDDAGKIFRRARHSSKKLDEWSLLADPLHGFLRVFATLGMSESRSRPVSRIRLYSTSYPPMKTSPTRCLKVNATPTFLHQCRRIKGANLVRRVRQADQTLLLE